MTNQPKTDDDLWLRPYPGLGDTETLVGQQTMAELVEEARDSERRQDWQEALRRWVEVRTRFPDNVEGHLHTAIKLHQLDRFDDADAILRAALKRFPEDAAVALEHARVAHIRADWPEALRRWRSLQAKYPEIADGLSGAGVALTQLGNLDEADGLLADARERFPNHPNVAIEYARVAHVRADWPEALRRWRLVRERFPHGIEGHLGVDVVLREMSRFQEASVARAEADIVLREASVRAPDEVQPAIQFAQAATRRGEWPEALRRWEAVREGFPDNAEGHAGVGAVLMRMGRYDDAEVALATPSKRFPTNQQIAVDYAAVAHHRRDWTEALRRWEFVRTEFNDSLLSGYTGAALALREAGRPSEADELLRKAMSRFPEGQVLPAYWRAEQQFHRLTDREASRYLVDRAMAKLYSPWETIHTVVSRSDLHDFVSQYIGSGVPLRYLEFGVAGGESIRGFAHRFTHAEARFTGFDSFEGLPEAWEQFPAGTFSTSGRLPVIDDARVDFVKGWFQNALSNELPGLAGEKRIVLVHYDADLYSATLFLLSTLWHAIPEYYFIMDEFPGDEVRALHEFSIAYPVSIELIAKVEGAQPQQVFGKVTRRELEDLTGLRAMAAIVAQARDAERSGDWPNALRCWEAVRSQHPDYVQGYLHSAVLLHKLARFDEADAVLTPALERFPQDGAIMVEYARVAHIRADWPEALRRWQLVRNTHPTGADGISGASVALMQLGRLDEADALLAGVPEQFPNHANVAIEYARVAHIRADWPEALRRWQLVRGAHPDNAIGVCGVAVALAQLGQLDEADTLLANALERLPRQANVAIEYARVAHRRGDWTEALCRWEFVRQHFPDDSEGYLGVAVALSALNRIDDLDTVAGGATKQFPENARLAIEYAGAASHRGDWAEAIRRWEDAHARFPVNQAVRDGLGTAIFRSRLMFLDQGGHTERHGEAAPIHLAAGGHSPADLMMRFESLGSGCEFGLVQRHFGAEPLGLLRWGAIPSLKLAEALDDGFAEVGEATNVRLFEREESKEFFFRDTKYSLEMHTFLPARPEDHDRVFAQQCRRARYLTRKLLEDLKIGEKIFVYKQHTGALPDREADAIYGALRRHGQNTLLCVLPEQQPEHPAGTVEVRDEGLMYGYVEALSLTSFAPEIRYESWLEMLKTAYDLWRFHEP